MNHSGPTLAVYLLGTLGVAYHLANGLHAFAMGWGVVTSRRALRRLGLLAVVAFVVLLGMSWAAIYAFWEAGASIA
jgi:succinate dehydrogenase / fumarate reductase cytochrome b subunit